MVLQHGTTDAKVPGGKVCSNQPAGLAHRSGYTSFWVYTWYAPGVGPVKEQLIWDERSCSGLATAKPGEDLSNYDLFYIDENWQ